MADGQSGPHEARLELASRVRAQLERTVPRSSTDLRGSVAAGTDDDVSDLDLAWFVRGFGFGDALDLLPTTLAEVAEVESLRFDPDTDPPVDRALVFVRFAGAPLFLGLDLEVIAIGHPKLAGPVAWRTDWSRSESAMMNALATVKALHRSQPETADGLLLRGFERMVRLIRAEDGRPGFAP